MSRFEPDSDARRLGEALATLRRERGLSQAEAGARAGLTSQGWGLYESGKRSGLYRPDVQRRLTAAIDASPEALALNLGPIPETSFPVATGVRSSSRAFTDGSRRRPRLSLSNDDLAPWAASGVVLEYDPERWPRRDQGCVIELDDGQILVRLYERADEEALFVRRGPGVEAERLSRERVAGVSAVTARLEE